MFSQPTRIYQLRVRVKRKQICKMNAFLLGHSSTTTTTTTYRQTFGKCQRCGKYEKRTMHMQCHHITCCLTCAKECKTCPHPQCGLPVVDQKNRHFAVYACKKLNLDLVTYFFKSFYSNLISRESFYRRLYSSSWYTCSYFWSYWRKWKQWWKWSRTSSWSGKGICYARWRR